MNEKVYEYEATITTSEIGKGGAYVPFPYDIRAKIGKQPGDAVRVTVKESGR